MMSKSLNLIVLYIYLILESSYGDGDTKDVQGENWRDNQPSRPDYTKTVVPIDPFYPELRAVLGGTFELPCSTINAYGVKFNVSWSRKANLPLTNSSRQQNGVLYIDNVEKEAQGEYICTTFDSSNRTILDTKYYITVMIPPTITVTLRELEAYPGEHTYINCSATGDQPIEIYWLRWGSAIPSSVYTRYGYISFNSTQLEDAGRYLCVARNRAGNATAEVVVKVEVPPKITLTSSTGHTNSSNSRIVAHPGEFHFINCSATGDQPMEISWSSLGRDFSSSVYTKDGYISFNSTQLQDAGRYMCVATNRPGKAGAVADFIVEVPPSIKLSSTTIELRQGESGFVDCYATGDQPMNISWSVPGGILPDSVYIRDRVIGFKNIQKQDAGRYLCVAKNRAGKESAEVNVIVKVPPTITLSSYRLVTYVGTYPSVTCSATGDPTIELYWLPYQRTLPGSVYIQNGYIAFNYITSAHAGSYICLAKNPNGIATARLEVIVT